MESRSAHRQRVRKSGTAAFTGTKVDCLIPKLMETGATLEFEIPADIPAVFGLVVTGTDRVYRCHVLWRLDKRIGVVFG
uniref:PilZ domain-containing protein n=1 Tax=Rhodopseudomonas palustris (strain BisA53) TaxID=316055 RepID=Q07ID2_RHOP5